MSDANIDHGEETDGRGLDLTSRMRADLRKLEETRPLGMARVRNGWAGLDKRIAKGREAPLKINGLARVEYEGHRYPRLKITAAGRRAIGFPKYEDVPIDGDQEA